MIYAQQEYVDELMQNIADFNVTVSWMASSCLAPVSQSHSHGDVRGESGLRQLASVNRRTRLRNGHVAD